MKNVFDIANSVRAMTRVCTREEFERVIDSQIVKSICDEIANTPIEGDFHDWKDKINPIKKKLPILTPHAHFTDSHRSNKSGESSPWMSMDFDGIDNPQEFWEEKLEPMIDELRIVLAFISPSRKGIKVISQAPTFTPPSGAGGLEVAQAWFAKKIGVEEYDHTHDLARCVYLVPRSYILLYKPEILFGASLPQPFSPPEETGVNTLKEEDKEPEEISTPLPIATADGEREASQSDAGKGAPYDPTLSIGGILYSDIVAAYFQKKVGHWPKKGERHAALVSWVNAAFGLICDNDKELMLKVTPRLKPDDEIVEIVNNVEKYHNKHFNPYESKKLKEVIAELQSKKVSRSNIDDDDLLDQEMQSELPPLPPPLKVLADICPQDYKVPMIIVAMIMYGELLCRLRARLSAWEVEFPGFFYVLEAQAGGAKRFIEIASELILGVAKENDKKQEEIYNNWAEEKSRHESDAKYVAPPMPKPVYMMGPNKISPSELMKEAMHNKGVGILTIGEEIDTHTNSTKGGASRDTSDMERIGFDGASMTQRYAGQGTVYGTAELFLSFIFTGTPKSVDRAFPDAENGLVTRYVYDFIDTRYKPKPVFKGLSKKDERMVRKYAERAIETCFDEDGNVLPIQMMNMDWALPSLDKWHDDYLHLAQVTHNDALDAFRRRPPKLAMRAMMVAYWLWGKKKSHREDVIKFGVWFADHAIDSQMKRFGSSFVEQKKNVDIEVVQSVKRCKSDALLECLPDVFATETIDAIKAKLGLDSASRKIISRLKAKGLVEKVDTNKYRKIK